MIDFHTTDLCDAFPSVQVCEPIFKSFGGRAKFCGPIATVKVYEDNVLYLGALESVPAGTVIVVDGGGSTRCALMGDRLGGIAESRGIPGVIIYGCVRDSAELAKQDVGIRALATSPRKSRKLGDGQEGIPLVFARVSWQAGHFVYVDEDGIIVSENALI